MTMWLCLTSCFVYFNGSIHQEVFLIVETLPARTKERLRNLEPRRFFESIAAEAMACRHHLKLGDFAWVLQPASPATPAHCLESVSMSLNHCPLVNLLVERKRIADLVGRSAVGDHLKQLRRMEDSALQHLFFLIEATWSTLVTAQFMIQRWPRWNRSVSDQRRTSMLLCQTHRSWLQGETTELTDSVVRWRW